MHNKYFKLTIMIIVLAFVLGACAQATPEEPAQPAEVEQEEAVEPVSYKIGYSQFWGTNPFLLAMTNGANKAVEEWADKGVEIDLIVTNGGDTDASKQVADTEDLFAQGVDGLVIFPGDSILLSEPIKNIYNKNDIPVVVTDIGLESGDYEAFFITDNYEGGQKAADLMVTVCPEGSKVVSFDNAPGNVNSQNRQAGFEDRAKELGLEVLPELLIKLGLEDGRRVMEDTLVSTPDLCGAFFITQIVAQGAVSALDTAGRTGEVHVVTFDVDPIMYEMVKEGKVLGVIMQDPWRMGYEGINSIITVLQGGTVQKEVSVPAQVMTKDNTADFADDPQITGE